MTRSQLIIHDTQTQSETLVFESDALIEAPNWSPCGRFLIVNGEGRIYRINLDAPDLLHPIDTGDILACNNDHGISPDGTQLVISDSPGRGTSLIYVLPITGGTPRQVTPLAPSYWHGWSPDGQTLAYTARRNGVFQIATIPVVGGDEQILTAGPGHRDGPDYTPDGKWIWFNSDHHGQTPDLFRMRTDGGDLQQMTDEATVNWFPHPSPDGREVLYLAYPPETEGHPRDKDVALKLIKPDGSNPREIARFNGGQGSINVPCWAPDSTRFAYMRYQ